MAASLIECSPRSTEAESEAQLALIEAEPKRNHVLDEPKSTQLRRRVYDHTHTVSAFLRWRGDMTPCNKNAPNRANGLCGQSGSPGNTTPRGASQCSTYALKRANEFGGA